MDGLALRGSMDCAVGANMGWMERVLLTGIPEYIADGTGITVDADGRGLNVTRIRSKLTRGN